MREDIFMNARFECQKPVGMRSFRRDRYFCMRSDESSVITEETTYTNIYKLHAWKQTQVAIRVGDRAPY